MEKIGKNLKILVNSDLVTRRCLTPLFEEEDPELKWTLQKNLDGYVIYRKIEDITEKFVIKKGKTCFETQLKENEPKRLNSKNFVISDNNSLELLSTGRTTVTSYIVEDLQNGELTLWIEEHIPEYMKPTFRIVSDYKLKKFFKEKRTNVNQWFVDITTTKLIAKKNNLIYTLNLITGEETLRKDSKIMYIKHHNILNFNEINFNFNEEEVELIFELPKEIISGMTE